MNLENKVEIYNYCNVLFQIYEQENWDCIFIEDCLGSEGCHGIESCFGDKVMKTAGEKYGLSIQEVEEIYAEVQVAFAEYAVSQLLNINSTKEKERR